MKGAVAIFAKTAELTPVKTRLAKTIGRARADAFYQLSVAATQSTLKRVQKQTGGKVQPYWALAEEEAIELPQWGEFPAIWTGEGDLGERLNCVSDQLFAGHDFVMMIGTDSPQIGPDKFMQSIFELENSGHDCVVGPSMDGGFYLIVSRRPVPDSIWKSVTYSTNSTLAELTTLLGKQEWKIHRLSQELDVDEVEDLLILKRLYANADVNRLPAQKALATWLANFE